MSAKICIILGCVGILFTSCNQPTPMDTLTITSSAFQENAFIPSKYACEGLGINPELSWSGISEYTKTIALLVDDPDAPPGTFVHWIAWNINPHIAFTEGSSGYGYFIEGKNSAGENGYIGPCPPHGDGIHHYQFHIFALDDSLDLETGSTRMELESAIDGHVLGEGVLTGLYERK